MKSCFPPAALAVLAGLVLTMFPIVAQAQNNKNLQHQLPGSKRVLAIANAGPLHWLVTGSNMNRVRLADPQLASDFFDNSAAMALGNPRETQVQVPAGYRAQPTLVYRSFASFRADLDRHRIDSRITAVVYDPEAWSDTPLQEQRDSSHYMELFSRAAHGHNLAVVLSPGRDLAVAQGASCTKAVGETLDAAYIRCGFARIAAKFGDAVEIQAQVDEASIDKFANLVTKAADQVHSSGADVAVFVGLSTSAVRKVASRQIYAAAKSVASKVDGFWLTIQASDARQWDVGLGFLRLARLNPLR